MDIKLGKLDLTKEQFARSETLKNSNVRGFSLSEGEITVVVINELTEAEKTSLISSLKALDASPLPKTRLEELKEKPILTVPEITEVLKIHGLV